MSGKQQVGSILSKVVKEDFTEKSSFEQGPKVAQQGHTEIRAACALEQREGFKEGKRGATVQGVARHCVFYPGEQENH